jgi:hypothetical protein
MVRNANIKRTDVRCSTNAMSVVALFAASMEFVTHHGTSRYRVAVTDGQTSITLFHCAF